MVLGSEKQSPLQQPADLDLESKEGSTALDHGKRVGPTRGLSHGHCVLS